MTRLGVTRRWDGIQLGQLTQLTTGISNNIRCHAQHTNWGKKGEGGTPRVRACVFSSHCYMGWSSAFLEVAEQHWCLPMGSGMKSLILPFLQYVAFSFPITLALSQLRNFLTFTLLILSYPSVGEADSGCLELICQTGLTHNRFPTRRAVLQMLKLHESVSWKLQKSFSVDSLFLAKGKFMKCLEPMWDLKLDLCGLSKAKNFLFVSFLLQCLYSLDPPCISQRSHKS